MQNSARCVLPVTSTSRWRKTRSTSHGGQLAAARGSGGRRSPARRGCRSAPRRRAAPGSSGRRTGRRRGTTATDDCASSRPGCAAGRAGAGSGCRPASRRRGRRGCRRRCPVCRPSSMNFSVPRRRLPRFFVERRGLLDQLVPAVRGVDVDFDHARVGRDLEVIQPWIVRRRDSPRSGPASAARPPCPRRRRPGRGSPRASSCGGMKTCSRPSRGSTQSAVRTSPGTDWPTSGRLLGRRLAGRCLPAAAGRSATGDPPARAPGTCRGGKGSRCANGSRSSKATMSSGVAHGSESSGRRKPIGESPGIRNMRSRRRNHGPLTHSDLAVVRRCRRSGRA